MLMIYSNFRRSSNGSVIGLTPNRNNLSIDVGGGMRETLLRKDGCYFIQTNFVIDECNHLIRLIELSFLLNNLMIK